MLTALALDELLWTRPRVCVLGRLDFLDALLLAMPEVKGLGMVDVDSPNDAQLVVFTDPYANIDPADNLYVAGDHEVPVIPIDQFTAALKRVCGGSNAMLRDAMWLSDLPKGPGF